MVVILGTFTLLISDIAVPSWLIGTIGTLTTGIIGVNIGNGDNGN